MSLVRPGPQVRSDVDRYTPDERRLLREKFGITDWASNKFSDEGEILPGHPDPDAAYDRLIRPEKIWLGLGTSESSVSSPKCESCLQWPLLFLGDLEFSK